MKGTVLHICDYSANYKGNFIESLLYLAEKDEKRKHIYLFPVKAKTTRAVEWIQSLNTEGLCVYIQEENFWKNVVLLYKIIKNNNVECIVKHFSDMRTDVILKMFFSNMKVIRLFHSMYCVDPKSIKHKLRAFLYRNNILVGVSKAASVLVEEKFQIDNVYTLENAIYFPRLDKIDTFDRSDKISVLIMGFDLFRKGVDLAIQACSLLREQYDLVLYVAMASNEDVLMNYVKEAYGGLPEWIVPLPPIENIATYYNRVDIFLSPSRSEAFGYAVVEAAYCKKSIVASKVDGQGELKIDSIYWCEKDSVKDLYAHIEMAIKELKQEEKINLRQKVAEHVQKEYSLERWSSSLIKLIEQ